MESGVSLQRYLRMDLLLRQRNNQESKFTFRQDRQSRVASPDGSGVRRVASPAPVSPALQPTMKRIYSVGRLAQPVQASRVHVTSPAHHPQHSRFGSGSIPNAVFSRSIVQDGSQSTIKPLFPPPLHPSSNVSFSIHPPPTARYQQSIPTLVRNSSTPVLQNQPSLNINIPPIPTVSAPPPPATLISMAPVNKINPDVQQVVETVSTPLPQP